MTDFIMAREFLEHVAYEAMEQTAITEHSSHGTVLRNGANAFSQRYSSGQNPRGRAPHPVVRHSLPLGSFGQGEIAPQHSGHSGTLSSGAAPDSVFDLFIGLFRKGKKSRNNSNSSLDGIMNKIPEQSNNIKGTSSSSTSDGGELESYEVVENIELSHMNGFVMGSKREQGRGHDFVCLQLKNPTWCDNCGEFIWGVYKQCLACKYCQYTCHHQCRQNVTLDCNRSTDGAAENKEDKEEPLFSLDSETALNEQNTDTVSQLDDGDSGYHTQGSTLLTSTPSEYTLSCEDLKRRIEEFNKEAQGLHLTIHQNTQFEGFIRVNMNLMRPINMSIGQRPPSIYEMLTSGGTAERENTKTTSFYLPRDTIKALHISSETTAQEVITALLNKYQITDNPRKFALYEQTLADDRKVMMRKIIDHEQPLVICLNWKAEDLEKKRFVLQENDTGEIMWEAFSVPELHNFLRILDREEAEYIDQVKSKYCLLRFHMEHRMKELEKEAVEKRKELSDSRQPVFV